MKQDLNLAAILPALKERALKISHYAGLLFFVLVAGIYIFVLFRINTLSNAQPTPADLEQSTSQKLKVDPKVVEQLEKLEDNSVNVQSLFDEARSNPFEESN